MCSFNCGFSHVSHILSDGEFNKEMDDIRCEIPLNHGSFGMKGKSL